MARTRGWLQNLRRHGTAASGTSVEAERERRRTQTPLPPALRDRSISRGPIEAEKHVRIMTPTPQTPPRLDDIVGEMSPQRAGESDTLSAPSSQLSGTTNSQGDEPQGALSLIIGEPDGTSSSEDSDESDSHEHTTVIVGEGDVSEDSESSEGGDWGSDAGDAAEESTGRFTPLDSLIIGEGSGEESPASISSDLPESVGAVEVAEGGDSEDVVSPRKERMDTVDEQHHDGLYPNSSASSEADVEADELSEYRLALRRSMVITASSPSMLDGILPNIPPEFGMDVRSESTPPSTQSETLNSEQPSPEPSSRTSGVLLRLSHLRSRRESVANEIEHIQQAETTARTLGDSPFVTSSQYWQAHQMSLVRRVVGVDELWEDLQEQ